MQYPSRKRQATSYSKMQTRLPATRTLTAPGRYRSTKGRKYNVYRPMSAVTQRPTSEIKSYDLAFDLSGLANGTCVGEANVAGVGADNGFDTGMSAINLVSAGSAFYQRIGSKIFVKSIEIEGCVEQGASAGYKAYGRYLIVYDRQANGAYPTLQNILQDNDSALTFNSGVNMQNRSRFAIIRDKRFVIDSGSNLQYNIKEYCKGMWEVEYGTSTGLIGDVRTGAIYFILFMNGAGGGGNDAIVPKAIKSRIRYWDN